MRNLININNIKWTCHHLHLDKSKTMNRDILEKSFVHMKDKWKLIRDIKKNYTMDDLKKRLFSTSMSLKKQGCYKMRTFIDVDHIVGLKPLYAEIKHVLNKQGIELQLGTQLARRWEARKVLNYLKKLLRAVDFVAVSIQG